MLLNRLFPLSFFNSLPLRAVLLSDLRRAFPYGISTAPNNNDPMLVSVTTFTMDLQSRITFSRGKDKRSLLEFW